MSRGPGRHCSVRGSRSWSRSASAGRRAREPTVSRRVGSAFEDSIETQEGRLRIVFRQLDVSQSDLGRMEHRRGFQRRVELARRALQIAGLEKRPAAELPLGRARTGERDRHDRCDEIRIAR